MTTDDRNFRSTYYEKVGCRSVEEKKSLEILLKEKPRNRLKLKQFCLSYTVPAVHRNLLWKLLLDVAPIYQDCNDFVMDQRKEVYDDLLGALKVMNIINDRTSLSNVFYAMWLLENKQLSLNQNIKEEQCNFAQIAEVLQQTFENKVDLYWVTKGFYKCALEIVYDFEQLKDLTFKLLEKENNTIYRYLQQHELLDILPLERWYGSCFSGVLTKLSLIRIWDKICGGSRKIVVFVFIVLFRTIWRTSKLPYSYKLSDILAIIGNIKDNQETGQEIVNKSIELWQQNKDHTEFRVLRKSN